MDRLALSTQFSPTIAQTLRKPVTQDEQQALRAAAEKFVGQTFFAPMLRQMRNSPFKNEVLSGGRGGEVFSSMLDGMISERMGRGAGGQLVDALVKHLMPRPTKNS
jgi:Rod binding domain-containing protein